MPHSETSASPALPTVRPDPAVPAAAIAVAVVTLLVLAAAPAGSNLVWAVNGLRSLDLERAVLLLLAAVLSAAWVMRPRLGAVVAAAGALVLAWPLREAGHFLGDTFVRWRQLDFVRAGAAIPGFAQLARQMHAQPLDNLTGLWGPLRLIGLGVPPALALSMAGFALALLFFWTVARLAERLVPEGDRGPFAAALAISGSLQVFAGYAESGGVALAFGALWWVTLLRPLRVRRDALWAVLAWLALALAHRIALVALVPQLVRALAVRLDGDEDSPRRDLLAGTIAAGVAAIVVGSSAAGGAVGRDLSELLGGLGRITPPFDVLNMAVLAMPFALLAPWLAGPRNLRAAARSPEGALHAVALLVLLPLLLVYPTAAHGLGAHRDWELAVLPGFVAASFVAHAFAKLDAERRRGALVALLPALLLLAGGWVTVNSDERATARRAEALVTRAFGPAGEQRGHALVYMAYAASDRGDDAAGARWFDASFEALPNRRTALLAAESWMRVENWTAAHASLARAREQGPLPDDLERVARLLEERLAAAEGAGGDFGRRP